MKNIYLCARVAPEARALNLEVGTALRQAGYEVYLPQEQPFNNTAGSTDKDIFDQDMAAMVKADACVIVGKIGVDCGFEAGFFNAKKVPTVWYSPPLDERHPMFYEITASNAVFTLDRLLHKLSLKLAPPRLLDVLMGMKHQ